MQEYMIYSANFHQGGLILDMMLKKKHFFNNFLYSSKTFIDFVFKNIADIIQMF